MPLVADSSSVYDTFLSRLKWKDRFAFSRFGDGEFHCIFGKVGANCDGHQYFPDLGRRLRGILESRPPYTIGIQALARRLYSDNPEFRQLTDFAFVEADALHWASAQGRLGELFERLNRREVVLVGPRHVGRQTKFSCRFVEVPSRDCWLSCDEVREKLIPLAHPEQVFVFCASFLTKVLIDELWRCSKSTLIDAGSVLDPYVGVKSRKYHHSLRP